MAAPEYSPLVVEHFEQPLHCGQLPPAADVIAACAGASQQGAMFKVSARIDRDTIKEVRFQVFGCPHCIAAGSWTSTQLPGLTVEQLEHWSWRDVAKALDVPLEKRGRLLVLEDAIHALAALWRRRQ